MKVVGEKDGIIIEIDGPINVKNIPDDILEVIANDLLNALLEEIESEG